MNIPSANVVSNVKLRVITATVLAFLVIYLLFFTSFMPYAIICTAFIFLCAWEWSSLLSLKSNLYRVFYLIIFAGFLWLAWSVKVGIVLSIALFWWLIVLFLIVTYPTTTFLWSSLFVKGFAGILTIIPAWLVLLVIRQLNHGQEILFFLLLINCSVDIGGYFVGKSFGKNHLAPLISPKKTWEGVGGSILVSAMVFLSGYVFVIKDYPENPAKILIILPCIIVFAIAGDLLESMMKRQCSMKDTAEYLPGHGGVLDRFDSFFASSVVFLFLWLLFNIKI